MEQIADVAGISKSNLFYYFAGKDDLYVAVLSQVLTAWLMPLNQMENQQDPAQALGNYIEAKFQLAKDSPQASRLYALEMMQWCAAYQYDFKKFTEKTDTAKNCGH